jgi:capsular polysaccharide biosynthesis protein
MQIHDYIPFARQWVPIALVLALICGGSAYAISKYVLKPVYTATATMQVHARVSSSNYFIDPTYNATLAETYAAVAEQGPIVRAGLRNATGASDPATQNRIIAEQSPSASCQSNGVTALFSCSVTANSPAFAATATNKVTEAFINQEKVWTGSSYTTVVTPASAPTAPSSPHPTLNGLVAFFLVFLLALGFGLGACRLHGDAYSADPGSPSGNESGREDEVVEPGTQSQLARVGESSPSAKHAGL